jgi:hypothetical protein
MLVVGQLPVKTPLVLGRQGDFVLNSVEPASDDAMIPDFHMDQASPMVWARVDREMYDP